MQSEPIHSPGPLAQELGEEEGNIIDIGEL